MCVCVCVYKESFFFFINQMYNYFYLRANNTQNVQYYFRIHGLSCWDYIYKMYEELKNLVSLI